MIGALMQMWRRRWWRPDAARLAVFEGLRPIKVVTGGSEGIGLEFARAFLDVGDDVLLVARTQARLADAAAALLAGVPAADRRRVAVLALDITGDGACDRIDAALAAIGGYCDVLINAAGIGAAGAFAEDDPERLDRLTALNVAALTRLCRHFLPGMLVRGRGGMLNVASLGGYTPGPYQAAYYASKSYVISLSEALAYESRGQGVRIAALAPGPVRTEFHRRMDGQTGLYLRLLPVAAPERIARTAVVRFRLGQRVILPGVVAPVMMLALRALPHGLTTPVVAWLLRPR